MFDSDEDLRKEPKVSHLDFYESQVNGFDEFRGSQDSDRTLSYISDLETTNPKSQYNKERKRDIKDLAK